MSEGHCTYCGSTAHTSKTHYDKMKDDSTMNALKYHAENSVKWSKVIDNFTDGIVAEIGRRFAVKEAEIERLETMLAVCLEKLATTPMNHRSSSPAMMIAHMPSELRDWYGKYRNREKTQAGKECFEP